MKTYYFLALIGLLISTAACEKNEVEKDCELEVAPGTRFFEFGHRGSDVTFYAWTTNEAVIQNVEAQLALPEADRLQHINGEIAELPEGCNWNKQWSWYFPPAGWNLSEVSIEVCDGNPQYVEDNLQDYLDIDRYCPWSSYVLREVDQPFDE